VEVLIRYGKADCASSAVREGHITELMRIMGDSSGKGRHARYLHALVKGVYAGICTEVFSREKISAWMNWRPN
jgi:hypothetical protein